MHRRKSCNFEPLKVVKLLCGEVTISYVVLDESWRRWLINFTKAKPSTRNASTTLGFQSFAPDAVAIPVYCAKPVNLARIPAFLH